MACPLATDDTRRAVLVKGTLQPVSPTARRSMAVLALVAAFAAARGPLHRATFALPVSNDDAILLLMGRHVLGGELATTLWNQPYNGALDAYLLAPLLAVLPHQAAYRLYQLLGAAAPRRARLPAGPPSGRPGRGVGGGAARGVGDALHGAHDRHGPAAELPDAARHRLPARSPALAALPRDGRLRARAPGARAVAALGLVCGLAVWNSSLAIPAFAGMAAGLALAGLRPRLSATLAFASGLALGAAPLLVARAIGASGAKVVTASSAVTALRPRWLWGQGLLDLGHALRGLGGPAGAARRGREGAARSCRPPSSSLLAAALLVAVAAGRPNASRAAAPGLGGGAGRRLLALAAHRPGRAALPLRPERARSRPGRRRVSRLLWAWRRPRRGRGRPGDPRAVGLRRAGAGRDVARPGSRRARVGGALPGAAPRRAAERSARAAPTRACSSPAASRSRRGGEVIASQAWNERIPGDPLRFRDEVDLDPAPAWVLSTALLARHAARRRLPRPPARDGRLLRGDRRRRFRGLPRLSPAVRRGAAGARRADPPRDGGRRADRRRRARPRPRDRVDVGRGARAGERRRGARDARAPPRRRWSSSSTSKRRRWRCPGSSRSAGEVVAQGPGACRPPVGERRAARGQAGAAGRAARGPRGGRGAARVPGPGAAAHDRRGVPLRPGRGGAARGRRRGRAGRLRVGERGPLGRSGAPLRSGHPPGARSRLAPRRVGPGPLARGAPAVARRREPRRRRAASSWRRGSEPGPRVDPAGADRVRARRQPALRALGDRVDARGARGDRRVAGHDLHPEAAHRRRDRLRPGTRRRLATSGAGRSSSPRVYLANEVVWRTSGFCGMRWITGAVAEASRRLFGYLSEHSATYFADRFAGALVNKIANAATGTERLISQWLWQFFPWIVGLLADLWITYLAHPYFALGARWPGWRSTSRSTCFWVSRLHKLSFAYAEASSQLRGQMVDTTTNIDTVQLTGEVAFERQHVGESIGLQRALPPARVVVVRVAPGHERGAPRPLHPVDVRHRHGAHLARARSASAHWSWSSPW